MAGLLLLGEHLTQLTKYTTDLNPDILMSCLSVTTEFISMGLGMIYCEGVCWFLYAMRQADKIPSTAGSINRQVYKFNTVRAFGATIALSNCFD